MGSPAAPTTTSLLLRTPQPPVRDLLAAICQTSLPQFLAVIVKFPRDVLSGVLDTPDPLSGLIPLQYALRQSLTKEAEVIARTLVGLGSDLLRVDRKRRTGAHYLLKAQNPDEEVLIRLLEFLLEHCKEIANMQDQNGQTPLHYACKLTLPAVTVKACVKTLLAHGASTSVQDGKGKTPLDVLKHPDVRILLERGHEMKVDSVYESSGSTEAMDLREPLVGPSLRAVRRASELQRLKFAAERLEEQRTSSDSLSSCRDRDGIMNEERKSVSSIIHSAFDAACECLSDEDHPEHSLVGLTSRLDEGEDETIIYALLSLLDHYATQYSALQDYLKNDCNCAHTYEKYIARLEKDLELSDANWHRAAKDVGFLRKRCEELKDKEQKERERAKILGNTLKRAWARIQELEQRANIDGSDEPAVCQESEEETEIFQTPAEEMDESEWRMATEDAMVPYLPRGSRPPPRTDSRQFTPDANTVTHRLAQLSLQLDILLANLHAIDSDITDASGAPNSLPRHDALNQEKERVEQEIKELQNQRRSLWNSSAEDVLRRSGIPEDKIQHLRQSIISPSNLAADATKRSLDELLEKLKDEIHSFPVAAIIPNSACSEFDSFGGDQSFGDHSFASVISITVPEFGEQVELDAPTLWNLLSAARHRIQNLKSELRKYQLESSQSKLKHAQELEDRDDILLKADGYVSALEESVSKLRDERVEREGRLIAFEQEVEHLRDLRKNDVARVRELVEVLLGKNWQKGAHAIVKGDEPEGLLMKFQTLLMSIDPGIISNVSQMPSSVSLPTVDSQPAGDATPEDELSRALKILTLSIHRFVKYFHITSHLLQTHYARISAERKDRDAREKEDREQAIKRWKGRVGDYEGSESSRRSVTWARDPRGADIIQRNSDEIADGSTAPVLVLSSAAPAAGPGVPVSPQVQRKSEEALHVPHKQQPPLSPKASKDEVHGSGKQLTRPETPSPSRQRFSPSRAVQPDLIPHSPQVTAPDPASMSSTTPTSPPRKLTTTPSIDMALSHLSRLKSELQSFDVPALSRATADEREAKRKEYHALARGLLKSIKDNADKNTSNDVDSSTKGPDVLNTDDFAPTINNREDGCNLQRPFPPPKGQSDASQLRINTSPNTSYPRQRVDDDSLYPSLPRRTSTGSRNSGGYSPSLPVIQEDEKENVEGHDGDSNGSSTTSKVLKGKKTYRIEEHVVERGLLGKLKRGLY
ncbi:hypothetical protein BC832DRAFT_392158 [Gaertneriomyces semiglobifer]|nr:hypothetical protein BC832DRAFT_392158 [Gaertneriomyces semiglobifer]